MPQPRLTQAISVPAPIGGINAVDAATTLPPGDATAIVNMIGGRMGLTSRLGYIEHTSGLTEVRTVIPFTGSDAAHDRLFAATQAGIWDVTAANSPAVSEVTFGIQNDDSGWGSFTAMVTIGGHFLFYADEANGLYVYTSSSDTWTRVAHDASTPPAAGKIGSADPNRDLDPASVVFVTLFKNRLWMVKRGTGEAYFLDVGVIAGEPYRQSFGNKFQHGGYLVGLWGWSASDAGAAGLDDRFVAISSAGDVLVYAGADPLNGPWDMVSSWFVGTVPAGRRIASNFGGDILIVSMVGAVPMSRIVTGTIGADLYTTRKIQALFNQYAAGRASLRGWDVKLHPESNAIIINLPLFGASHEQLAMSLATQGWSVLEGVPSLCFDVWRGQLYFGTSDGRVCVATGDMDEVSSDSTTAQSIEWSGLTSFQCEGSANRKRLHMVKPRLITQGGTPGYEVAARYDFDMSAVAASPGEPVNVSLPHWDSAHWDVDRWPGVDAPAGQWRGVSGPTGAYAAIAWRGRSQARTTLVGFDVQVDSGGIL